MKKIPTLVLSLFVCIFTLNAQQISFTFTANHSCEYAPLDSVVVENLSQGGDTVLYYPDTVLNMISTDVDKQTGMHNNFYVSHNYPNPFSSQTKIDIFVPEQDNFTISVFDITGRQVTTYENSLEKGMHNFTFTAGNNKNYLLSVNSTKYAQRKLMISVGADDNPEANLTYNGIIPEKRAMQKSSRSYFAYEVGNELKFNGFVDGGFLEINDTPLSDKVYMFDINCPFSVCGEDEIVDVTNPTTGDTWMDRNLGASQQATASDDYQAYGALFQWGRSSDGHECITWTSSNNGSCDSSTTSDLSSSDDPGHSLFITTGSDANEDWRYPQNNDLWDGISGINNPCPEGYRLPTATELDNECTSWATDNAAGAYASPLKFPVAGNRYSGNGSLYNTGSYGYYWSSTVDGTTSRILRFAGYMGAGMYSYPRAYGYSVRCIKD